MELTQEEKTIVDKILQDIADLQKEFTRLFFYREVRRELIVEKLAEAHLKLAELALAREITQEEIQEKIRTYIILDRAISSPGHVFFFFKVKLQELCS